MRFMQLDIFSAPDIGYHEALECLLDFRHREAEKAFAEWQRAYPGRRALAIEQEILRFLCRPPVDDGLAGDSEAAFRLWEEEWEPRFSPTKAPDTVLGRFRLAYFRRVAKNLQPSAAEIGGFSTPVFWADGRAVLCLLRGHRWFEAAYAARQLIPSSPNPGRLYGYLGDALYQQGLEDDARRAYFHALLEGPGDLDVDNLCDPIVFRLITDPDTLLGEEPSAKGKWEEDRGWAAAIGLLTRVFSAPILTEVEDAANWWRILSRPQDDQSLPLHPGKAFVAGIILSDQGLATLARFGLDISTVRHRMKVLESQLFAFYMVSRLPISSTGLSIIP